MNILLINSFFMPLNELSDLLSMNSDLRRPFFTWPLGVLSLAAYARSKNTRCNFRILDANKELHAYTAQRDHGASDIREFLLRMFKGVDIVPDVIGISVNISTGHSSSLMMAETAKAIWPQAVTVAGGIHVTNYSQPFIEHPSIDYVIRGAAEKSFTGFLAMIEQSKDPSGIPGVVTSLSTVDAFSPPLQSFDEVPMLAYDLVDIDYYAVEGSRNPTKQEDTRSISYQFSRGCCFNCSFCVGSTVHGKKVLRRSNELILTELDYVTKHYKINTIIIEDDLFGLDRQNFFKLYDQLKERHLGLRFSFPNALSVAVIDEQIIDALIEMGLDNAILAVESGSPHVQRHIIRKNCDLTKALRLARYLRSKQIPVMAYFILGFPGETVAMMRETIAFAKTMELDWAYFFLAAPLMGSVMCRELFEQGVITEEKMVEIMDNTRFTKRLYDTPEISASDLETLAYDANIDINFFDNFNLRTGRYDHASVQFSNILKNYPFHVPALVCRAKCAYALSKKSAARQDIDAFQELIRTHDEAKRLSLRYQDRIREVLKTMPEYAHLAEEGRAAGE